MNFDAQPAKYGLYDTVNEEDACGVSFVADMTGKETLATAFVGSSRVPAPAGQEQLLCPSAGISRRAATCTERSCMSQLSSVGSVVGASRLLRHTNCL